MNLNYESSTLGTNFQRSFKSFIIIDEFGTRYHFGGSGAIEFSDPIFYGYSNNLEVPAKGYLLQANSWFLNKIESADSSDVIHLEYERGPFVCQLFKASNISGYETANANNLTSSLLVSSGTITSPVYLKKISRSNGETIDFILNRSTELSYNQNDYTSVFQNPSNDDYLLLDMTQSIPRLNENYYSNKFDRIQWLKLDTINVKNSDSSRIKAITFSYNNNPEERLFLESLRFKGGGLPGSQPEPALRYDFTYNNKNKLGGYLSSITDHWGYNNGKGFPTNGIITELRNPDPDFMDAGVLSEIRYPTGGYTRFFFEPHDYSKVVNTKNRGVINLHTGIGGGLRIRRIISGDSTGIIQRRDFFYRITPDSSGVSSSTGVLNILPTYITNISGYDCDDQPFVVSSMKSYPVIPLSTENDGLNIGYTTICELYDEGSDGYAKYEYTNHDNGHSDTLLTNDLWNRDIFPQDPHCSRYFERGRLKNEMLYGNTGNLTYSRQINWSRYGSQGEDNPRAFYFGGLELDGGYDYCSSVPYLHYTYKFLRNEQREYDYYANGQNPVYTVNKYLYTALPYNPVGLLSRETIVNSDSDSISVNYRYAGDVLGASAPTPFLNDISAGVTKMLQRNMRGVVLEKTNSRNNLVTGSVVKYYVESNGQLQPSEELHLQSNTPVDNYTWFIINPATGMPVFDSRLNSELRYDLYDNLGNLLQATGRDGVPTSYVWGYKQQYVVAVVRGAAYSEVKSALGHASDGNDLTYLQNMVGAEIEAESNKLRNNLSGALVTSYTYKPGVGLTSATNPNGITTSYYYDSFGRLSVVRDSEDNILERFTYHYKNIDDYEDIPPVLHPEILVSSISVTLGSAYINYGTATNAFAVVLPDNATNKGITWSSSNNNVATVSSSGVVTGVSAGTCSITATAQDGSGVYASASLTVTTPIVLVTGITLNKTSLSIEEGSSEGLTATVSPWNATNKGITWSSSNNNVATVSSSGVVTGVSAGACSITATAQDGSGVYASASLTVIGIVAVTGVSLDKATASLDEGETDTLALILSPGNATNQNVVWSSSNPGVATVTATGVVTGISYGTATITVTTSDGGYTASCVVTVFKIIDLFFNVNRVIKMSGNDIDEMRDDVYLKASGGANTSLSLSYVITGPVDDTGSSWTESGNKSFIANSSLNTLLANISIVSSDEYIGWSTISISSLSPTSVISPPLKFRVNQSLNTYTTEYK